MIATVTFIGANEDYTGSPIVTAKSNLTSLSGYVAVEMQVNFVNPKPVFEGEKIKYLNDYEFQNNKYRLYYNLESVPIPFGSGTFIDEFPLIKILDKKFQWIDLNDYPYTVYSSPGTNCMRVNIVADLADSPGFKKWAIEVSDLKINMGRTSGF